MTTRTATVLALLLALSGCRSFLGEGGLEDQEINRAATHRSRGALLLRQGKLELAIREYMSSVEVNPYDAEAHFGYGEALRLKGHVEDAERELRRAIELDPTHHDARLNLCGLFLGEQRWKEAIAEADTLIADATFLNPARAYVNRGWAYYSQGDLARAEEDLQYAVAVDSALYQAHLNLGIVLYDRGETLEAMKTFDRALQILDKHGLRAPARAAAEARFRMAQAHVKLGQRDKALALLRLAADQANAGPWAEKAREYLTMLQ
jgi:tetratricopeptide (TPR) repeat protein